MSAPAPPLRPRAWLGDFFGPGHVYCPRSSSRMSRWLPRSRVVMDGATGSQLEVVGDLAVACARGAATPAALELMAEAGFQPPSELYLWDTGPDYLRLLRRLARAGRRLIVQYLHPADEIPPEAYWVPPGLLSELNDKANLEDWVAPELVPRRTVLSPEDAEEIGGADLPVVLKAASPESSGGGLAVRICHTVSDLAEARTELAGAERIVVEEHLDLDRTVCLGFAADADGRVTYHGAAEEEIDDDGRFAGNWLHRELPVPAAAIEGGLAAVRAAAARGYRGWAGVDVAFTRDDRVRVLDLNFRINNSTAVILLGPAIARRHSFEVARLTSWSWPAGFEDMIRQARRAMEDGHFLPLGAYDPGLHGQAAPPRMRGLVLGTSREEVVERIRALEERGSSGGSA